MPEITHNISPVQAEMLRQQLAAMLLFALPPKDKAADWHTEQRVKNLLHCIDMLDENHAEDWPACDGCGKVIEFKEEYVTYTDDNDSLSFCRACAPDEEAFFEKAHDPVYADQDIERARAWLKERAEMLGCSVDDFEKKDAAQ